MGVISGYSIWINKVQGSILPLAQREKVTLKHDAYGNPETEGMFPPLSMYLSFQQHSQLCNQNNFHLQIEMLHGAGHPLFNLQGPSSTSQRGQLKVHLCTVTLFNISIPWLLWGIVAIDDSFSPSLPSSAAVISALISFIDQTTHKNVTHHPLKIVYSDCSAKCFGLQLAIVCHNAFPI